MQSADKQQVFDEDDSSKIHLGKKEQAEIMPKRLFKRFLTALEYFAKVDRFQFLKNWDFKQKKKSINNIFWSLRISFLMLTDTPKDVTDP